MLTVYQQFLTHLDRTASLRQLPEEKYKGQSSCVDFSSNDYLGLAGEQRKNLDTFAFGSTGSRLLSGDNSYIHELEQEIATQYRTESALVYPTGYQANVSFLSTLLSPKILGSEPLVFFDKANHASLYDGLALVHVKPIRFPHNDLSVLEELLRKYASDSRPKYIITETLHSMEGDILDLEDLLFLARKFKAFLYLDDAHGTGLYGPQGYGLSTGVDFGDVPHAILGSFSKALGGSGAFIACHRILKELMVNRARGFIYSTAPSPVVTVRNLSIFQEIPQWENRRKVLWDRVDYMRKKLSMPRLNSPILNYQMPRDHLLDKAKKLQQSGLRVMPIIAPTVPKNSERLRICIRYNHSWEDLDLLVKELLS